MDATTHRVTAVLGGQSNYEQSDQTLEKDEEIELPSFQIDD